MRLQLDEAVRDTAVEDKVSDEAAANYRTASVVAIDYAAVDDVPVQAVGVVGAAAAVGTGVDAAAGIILILNRYHLILRAGRQPASRVLH